MPTTFEKVPQEVLDLVQEAIDQWHPTLKQARIGVCFRSEAQRKGEHSVWAAISKVAPAAAVLAKLDYILWLAKPDWLHMPRAARLALLDHELCHAIENDNGEWAIREHDVEEFYEVIERHGLWRQDLAQLGQVVRAAQARLPGFESWSVTAVEGAVITLDGQAAAAVAG